MMSVCRPLYQLGAGVSMPCPARRADTVAARRQFAVVAFDDVIARGPGRFGGALGGAKPGSCNRKSRSERGDHRTPYGTNQQGQPEQVGEKAGRQHQKAREHDQSGMRHRFGRVTQVTKGPLHICHRHQTLRAQKPRPEDRHRDHEAKSRPKTDPAADLDEQGDLDDRYHDEKGEKPHEKLRFCGRGLAGPGHIHKWRQGNHQSPPVSKGRHMNNSIIQLLVLAGVAIFLILKLRSVLGTRDGFEGQNRVPPLPGGGPARRGGEVIESGPDRDITDHVAEGSDEARALAAMKLVEPSFNVSGFLQGARGAYEMILGAFAKGELDRIRPFLSAEVAESFAAVIADRKARGLIVTSELLGIRELALQNAEFNRATNEAEVSVRFVGEVISATRDTSGDVVEGDPKHARKQRDVWTFARVMGANDPNWQLVATGE